MKTLIKAIFAIALIATAGSDAFAYNMINGTLGSAKRTVTTVSSVSTPVSAKTTGEKVAVENDINNQTNGFDVSADGAYIAFSSGIDGKVKNVVLRNTTTGDEKVIGAFAGTNPQIRISPTNKYVFFKSVDGSAIYNVETGKTTDVNLSAPVEATVFVNDNVMVIASEHSVYGYVIDKNYSVFLKEGKFDKHLFKIVDGGIFSMNTFNQENGITFNGDSKEMSEWRALGRDLTYTYSPVNEFDITSKYFVYTTRVNTYKANGRIDKVINNGWVFDRTTGEKVSLGGVFSSAQIYGDYVVLGKWIKGAFSIFDIKAKKYVYNDTNTTVADGSIRIANDTAYFITQTVAKDIIKVNLKTILK